MEEGGRDRVSKKSGDHRHATVCLQAGKRSALMNYHSVTFLSFNTLDKGNRKIDIFCFIISRIGKSCGYDPV